MTAAALIMTSVFVTFIPNGSATIKPIAFGLAIGVFVDAFVVRMTLVPAVLVVLGHKAWWLPTLLEKKLPEVDVEGAAMHRKVQYEDWERTNGTAALVARDVVLVSDGSVPVEVEAPPGTVTVVDVPDGLEAADLADVLSDVVGRWTVTWSWAACCCPNSARRPPRPSPSHRPGPGHCQLANRSPKRSATGARRAPRAGSAGRSRLGPPPASSDLTAILPVAADGVGALVRTGRGRRRRGARGRRRRGRSPSSC